MNLRTPDAELAEQIKAWWPRFTGDHDRYRERSPEVEALWAMLRKDGWK